MILIFLFLGVALVFYSDALNIDEEKFPKTYRISFAVLLVIYAGIRFSRLINKKDEE